LKDWRRRALSHSCAEKVFVDALLGANPDVIDVEVGLPGMPSGAGKANGDDALVAPRMDVVALEPWEGGYRLAFWEAKLSNNSEARAKTENVRVVKQLKKYREWLRDDSHKKTVIAAYSETCRMLVALHKLAKIDAPLGPAIEAVGTGKVRLVDLDPQVRLVIDDSGKHGVAASASFTDNGHTQKLRDAEIPLLLIGADSPLVLKV
jgi:hypothetical protein